MSDSNRHWGAREHNLRGIECRESPRPPHRHHRALGLRQVEPRLRQSTASPRASAGTSRASQAMRASSSARWTSPTSTPSTACRRRSPSTRRRPRRTRAPRWHGHRVPPDYLRLLFARIGTPHCPECGRVIERQTTDQVADKILEAGQGRRAFVLAPVVVGRKGEFTKLFEDLRGEGFSRVRRRRRGARPHETVDLDKKFKHTIEVVVDRIVARYTVCRIAEAAGRRPGRARRNVSVRPAARPRRPGGGGRSLSYSSRWPAPSTAIPSTTSSRATFPSTPHTEPARNATAWA